MPYCGEDFSPADGLDDDFYCLNLVGRLPPGVTIVSCLACRLTVVDTDVGYTADATPSARLNGPAAPATPQDGTSTAQVAIIQRLTDLVAGNRYLLDAWGVCSDGATRHISSEVYCEPSPVGG